MGRTTVTAASARANISDEQTQRIRLYKEMDEKGGGGFSAKHAHVSRAFRFGPSALLRARTRFCVSDCVLEPCLGRFMLRCTVHCSLSLSDHITLHDDGFNELVIVRPLHNTLFLSLARHSDTAMKTARFMNAVCTHTAIYTIIYIYISHCGHTVTCKCS